MSRNEYDVTFDKVSQQTAQLIVTTIVHLAYWDVNVIGYPFHDRDPETPPKKRKKDPRFGIRYQVSGIDKYINNHQFSPFVFRIQTPEGSLHRKHDPYPGVRQFVVQTRQKISSGEHRPYRVSVNTKHHFDTTHLPQV